jgi:hypothetical protein
MLDNTLHFTGCDSCSSSVCDGTCESPSISTAIDDAIIANILAEHAAFAASLPPREELTPCCDGTNGAHDLGCEYADACDCMEINERVVQCGSCREAAL